MVTEIVCAKTVPRENTELKKTVLIEKNFIFDLEKLKFQLREEKKKALLQDMRQEN